MRTAVIFTLPKLIFVAFYVNYNAQHVKPIKHKLTLVITLITNTVYKVQTLLLVLTVS